MSFDWQTLVAFAAVALAIAYLLRRAFSRKRQGECGCPPDKFKASLKR